MGLTLQRGNAKQDAHLKREKQNPVVYPQKKKEMGIWVRRQIRTMMKSE